VPRLNVIDMRGPGDDSPPEDESSYECQLCLMMFSEDDLRVDRHGLRVCPECGGDNVVLY
jgi:Zn finger protein HypA/HybF involved in hydrogenase expression